MRYRSGEAPRNNAAINRPVTRDEFKEAVATTSKQGIHHFDKRLLN